MEQRGIFERPVSFPKQYVSISVIPKCHKLQGCSLRAKESFCKQNWVGQIYPDVSMSSSYWKVMAHIGLNEYDFKVATCYGSKKM